MSVRVRVAGSVFSRYVIVALKPPGAGSPIGRMTLKVYAQRYDCDLFLWRQDVVGPSRFG